MRSISKEDLAQLPIRRYEGEVVLVENHRALVRAADELHNDAFISDAIWQTLSDRFDTPQLIDVIFAVGQYHVVSMALNTLGVQLDEGVKGFAP